MAVNYTSLLNLAQPVNGTESGTWGSDVNNGISSYLDIAIAGGLAVTVTTADVTLAPTQGTSSGTNITSTTSQYAILNVSGAMDAAHNLIVPSTSKWYIINNATTGGFALTVKGAATTGVALVNGEKAIVAWNGTDFVKISGVSGAAVFTSVTDSGLTSGHVTYASTGGLLVDSANLTFNGTVLTSSFAGPVAATTLSASSTVSGSGFSTYLASPPAIGGTAAAAGSFTTLSASSTVSGTGFSTYLASPPAIGGTAAAAGSFTTLTASTNFVGRINPRALASTANSATPTINTDNYDIVVITAQSVAITSFTTNLTGTPVNGQKLWISITGTGAIAITWGASFESSTITLPTTTVTTNRLDIGFVWNVATSKWRCVATA